MNQKDEGVHNKEKFETILAATYPELWRIHKTLEETKINPVIVTAVINAIYEVAYITGHGDVKIYISDRKITNIEPKPRVKLGVEVLLDKLEDI